MSKAIVISGWYGLGNIGDEAILQAMIDTFKSEYPSCQITVLSFDPNYTKAVQQVDAVHQIPIHGLKTWIKYMALFRWVSTLKAIKKCDLFVMGGGGFLSDWQPEVPKGWLKQMKLAKLFGKKTVLYRIGAGPFLTQQGKKETKYYIDKYVDEVSVRDKTSLSCLKQLGIKKPIALANDPVMDLQINMYNCIERKNIIAINFTPLFHTNKPKFDTYVHTLKNIIKHLHETYPEYSIRFISFYKSDRDFFKKYFSEMGIDCSEPKDYQSLLEQMRLCTLFIGTRFHSIVFSIKTQTPSIGIVYHHKGLDLCNKFNIPYVMVGDGSLPPIENTDINIEQISSYIDGMLKNRI